MKALRWHGKKDLRYEEIPEPSPGPGEVKIQVHFAGICGSDLHEYQDGPVVIPVKPHPITGLMAPITLGHEYSGTVVDLGEGVTDVKIGDRVTGECPLFCGHCYFCTRNAFVVLSLCFLLALPCSSWSFYITAPTELLG